MSRLQVGCGLFFKVPEGTIQSENGGRRGIRTLVTLSRKHAFQACAFNHSATLPLAVAYNQRFQPIKPQIAPL
jgi:hypothetical protein